MKPMPDMFATLKPPRAKPRKLMHVCDASHNDYDDGLASVRMNCLLCNHMTDWLAMSVTDAKRGIPCPKCNSEAA